MASAPSTSAPTCSSWSRSDRPPGTSTSRPALPSSSSTASPWAWIWVVAEVARPKAPKKLPVVLSQGEMVRFLDALQNPKHRALLMTAYAGGLRLSEVARLRVEDIDSARMVIHIRQAKGHKDRDVMLSPRLLTVLREYWAAYRPGPYLFPGRQPDRPVSLRTVQMVCERALAASGLSKH